MRIEVFVVSPFQENARIVMCEATKEAVVIDPGDQSDLLIQNIDKLGANIRYILATHGHLDHIGAVAGIQKKYKAPFYIHEAENIFVKSFTQQAHFYGLKDREDPQIDGFIQEKDVFKFGNHQLEAIFTPGHSPGSITFFTDGHAFVGDVLFAGSIGRTDLLEGDFDVLQTSINKKLYVLSPNTIVYPGHGPNTTIGREKKYNPFVKGV